VRQWAGDAAFTLPCVAAAALFLLPLVDREPVVSETREPLLTFSRVRMPKLKRRLGVPSALGMALELQSAFAKLRRDEPERKTS